jgi:glyoxylase-like metal-dependent hydrolase (beta-lactamase superfamily II)
MHDSAGNLVYALRYAERSTQRQNHFYGPIDRPLEPMSISYFVWLILTSDGPVLVDTGFTADTAARVGRRYLQSPREAVRAVGVDPDELGTVILTHLHYDHAGCINDFPNARFVLQRKEIEFWTGPYGRTVGCELGMSHLVLPEDIGSVLDAVNAGRVHWVDGDAEVAPGVTVHRVAGHTPGMQVVRVQTTAGAVVVASDATHFYENIECNRPFAVLDSVSCALRAFEEVRALTTDPTLVIPGHDPAVLDRFRPTTIPALAGNAVVIG